MGSEQKMRRFYLTILVLVLTVLVWANWALVSAATEKISSELLLYMRVAQLYAAEPDRKLAMPLQDVRKEQIANTWHALRSADRLHEGQDIFAPKGTPVLSATEGYIYNIGANNLGGQTVSVIGAGGRVYYYAHLDSYAPGIAVGDHVTTQTVLGYVGATGNAAGRPPHLHFGVYTTTGAINPLPLLSDRAKSGNFSGKQDRKAKKK